ncbi:hypothetical protein D3C72_1795190 [compost metagenome]
MALRLNRQWSLCCPVLGARIVEGVGLEGDVLGGKLSDLRRAAALEFFAIEMLELQVGAQRWRGESVFDRCLLETTGLGTGDQVFHRAGQVLVHQAGAEAGLPVGLGKFGFLGIVDGTIVHGAGLQLQ